MFPDEMWRLVERKPTRSRDLSFLGRHPSVPPFDHCPAHTNFRLIHFFFSNAKEISLLSIHNHEAATSVEYSGVTGL